MPVAPVGGGAVDDEMGVGDERDAGRAHLSLGRS